MQPRITRYLCVASGPSQWQRYTTFQERWQPACAQPSKALQVRPEQLHPCLSYFLARNMHVAQTATAIACGCQHERNRKKCCGWLSAASEALPRICECKDAVSGTLLSTPQSCTKRIALHLQDNQQLALHDTSNLCYLDYSSRCLSCTTARDTDFEPYLFFSGTNEPLLWLADYWTVSASQVIEILHHLAKHLKVQIM